jgi:hypothetical protein
LRHKGLSAAPGAVLSITKFIGTIPSFSPFDKGGWRDFIIDCLGSHQPRSLAGVTSGGGVALQASECRLIWSSSELQPG